jgi:type VI secretion system protein ImpL
MTELWRPRKRAEQTAGLSACLQSLKTRALGVLPADLSLRDQTGPTFDKVFVSADDTRLIIPQFLTRYGLQSYFVKQRDELVTLTAMDSWVLPLAQRDIQRCRSY